MYMVWEGKTRSEAAEQAGMRDHSLREALRKPHVKAFYSSELDVLRTSARAKNFHRLDAIADGSGNDMARVAAIKHMDALADATPLHGSNAPVLPGLQIVIVQRDGTPAPHQSMVDVAPNVRAPVSLSEGDPT